MAGPTTRRMTRSQTATVLGKRPAREISHSSSIASTKSIISVAMPTPESSPCCKRARLNIQIDDGSGNKENIPPLPSGEDAIDSIVVTRAARRTNVDPPSSPTPTRSRATPRRLTRAQSSQTPTASVAELTLKTPPPTPPATTELHVQVRALLRATSNACTNMSLSGREKERDVIKAFLHGFDDDGATSSSAVNGKARAIEPVLYISGSPGTGKTALVNSILASAPISEIVRVVFVNCMAYNGMDALWERLGEDMFGPVTKGKRSAAKSAYTKDNVIKMFGKEKKLKCILVLDELDHLSSSSSLALQPLIHLATTHSNLHILGIANTHTLSSSGTLLPPALEASAAHIDTLHFAPYSSTELLAILNTRLTPLPQEALKKLLPQPALMLLTKKIAALTGDVRALFEVLRGAVDLAVQASQSSDAAEKPAPSVTPAHILAALKSFSPTSGPSRSSTTKSGSSNGTNSETATKVRNLGLQARLVLLSLLLASKRLSSGLPISSSANTPTSSPSKRSPIKRSQSTHAVASGFTTSSTSAGASQYARTLDAAQLHSYYSSLLHTADAFTPVSRPDFTDLLGVLETTGLLSLSSAGASSGSGSGARAFKRSASFVGGKGKSAAGGGLGQCVRLQEGVREGEVARGLGVVPEEGEKNVDAVEVDVREEEVRVIWERESARIRREAKVRAMDAARAGVDGFDDAMED